MSKDGDYIEVVEVTSTMSRGVSATSRKSLKN